MDRDQARRMAAFLEGGVDDIRAEASPVGSALFDVIAEIRALLTPVVGARGVAALNARTLALAGAQHTWLRDLRKGDDLHPDRTEFQSVFKRQTAQAASAGGTAFLQTFYELLASLIGPLLTEQLLRPVWIHFLSAPSAQDPPP